MRRSVHRDLSRAIRAVHVYDYEICAFCFYPFHGETSWVTSNLFFQNAQSSSSSWNPILIREGSSRWAVHQVALVSGCNKQHTQDLSSRVSVKPHTRVYSAFYFVQHVFLWQTCFWLKFHEGIIIPWHWNDSQKEWRIKRRNAVEIKRATSVHQEIRSGIVCCVFDFTLPSSSPSLPVAHIPCTVTTVQQFIS